MSVVAKPEYHHLRKGLLFAADWARRLDGWVVVVCPVIGPEMRKFFSGIASDAVKFSGRTAEFSGGGRLSLTEMAAPVFVPPDRRFSVMFLGDGDRGGMEKWRQRAAEVIREVA